MIRCLRDPNTYTAAYQEKEKTENKPEIPKVDFADICGQEGARRAAEIAVSGFHNILFYRTARIRKDHAGKTSAYHYAGDDI